MTLSPLSVIALPGPSPWRTARAMQAGGLTLVAGTRAMTGDDSEAVALALDVPEGTPRPLLTRPGATGLVLVALEDGRALAQVIDDQGGRALLLVDPDAIEAPARPVSRLLTEDDAPADGACVLDGGDDTVPLAWLPGGVDGVGSDGRLLRLASIDGARATARWTTLSTEGLRLAVDEAPAAAHPLGNGGLLLVVTGPRGLSVWRRAARGAAWTPMIEAGGGRDGMVPDLAALAAWPPAVYLAAPSPDLASGRQPCPPEQGTGLPPQGADLWRLWPEADPPVWDVVWGAVRCTPEGLRMPLGAPPVAPASRSDVPGAVIDLAPVPGADGAPVALLALIQDGAETRVLATTDGLLFDAVAMTAPPAETEALPARALALAPCPAGGPPRVLVSP